MQIHEKLNRYICLSVFEEEQTPPTKKVSKKPNTEHFESSTV